MCVELLDDETERALAALTASNSYAVELVAHLGLLGLCRAHGIEAAYQLRGDAAALRTRPISDGEGTDVLAAARLRTGLDDGAPEAHFAHAVAAAAGGLRDEAAAAITRCASTSASWELRRLIDLERSRPDLAEGIEHLRKVLGDAHASLTFRPISSGHGGPVS